MRPRHIIAIIVVLGVLSMIPFFFGKKVPKGTVTTEDVFKNLTAPTPSPAPAPSAQPAVAPVPAAQTPPPAPAPVSLPTPPATPPAPRVEALSISGFSFPQQITVKKGTRVVWTNNDSVPHTITSDSSGVFDSSLVNTGGTFSFTFTTVGTFAYHCNFHPSMHASITVTD